MQTQLMSQGAEAPQPAEKARPAGGKPAIDLSRIAQDLQIRRVQVESAVALLDEGNTIPFIARYRRDKTSGLPEDLMWQIQKRVHLQRQLAERKQTILKSIEGQGKLTDDLRLAVESAETPKRLDDLYLPYKPKKRTPATIARERGLDALAQAIWNRDPAVANLAEVLPGMVNPEKELKTTDDVLLGVQQILAEQISETAELRAAVRRALWETGKLCTAKAEKVREDQGNEYRDYFQFTETVRHIPPHRILAINRGEREGVLKIRLEWQPAAVERALEGKMPLADHPHAELLKKALEEAMSQLVLPALEREIRKELTDEAAEHAVRVFARNLRSLLLQRPSRNTRVLAMDPGFRAGCCLAALDEAGNVLEHATVHPFPPPRHEKGKGKSQREGSKTGGSETRPTTGAANTNQAVPATAAQNAAPASATEAHAGADPSTPAPDGSGPSPTLPAREPTADTTPSAGETAGVISTPPVTAPAPDDSSPSLTLPAREPTADAAPLAAAPVPETVVVPAEPAPDPAVVARALAKAKIEELVHKHQIAVVAIGNGKACREAEELIALLIAEKLPELSYVVVNEAGAGVYAMGPVGREEFPSFDPVLRATISIGRRLQDPLAELVKVDPQNVGVGLYQHDLHPRKLRECLQFTVEACVNSVGVDLNVAGVPLLRHISALNQLVARDLIHFRTQHGGFRSREQLLQVPSIAPSRFQQAAGFLRVKSGDNPLDETWVHPESYALVQNFLTELGFSPEVLRDPARSGELAEKVKTLPFEETARKLQMSVPALRDLIDALVHPGQDPRDTLPAPVFKKTVLKLEDLKPEMELRGTVLNVVDFGAFVDIGLKDSGLVHISQMANRYIKNPYDIVAVGDVVTTWVLSVDKDRRRVSLTMIKPGTPRRSEERKERQERPQQGGPRPPRRPQPVHAGRGQQRQTGAPPATQAVTEPARQPAQAPRPPQRPLRKPHRAVPKPKLSQAALEGAAPLRTFSELKAFFEAQQTPPASPPPPAQKPADESAPPAG
jgi:uncharacterized protein